MGFLIIGGSDAGISAALRAREVNAETKIDVLLEDDFPNYSICGLPFYLSGETPDWHSLAHRTEFAGISVRRGHRATRIDCSSRTVEVQAEGKGRFSSRTTSYSSRQVRARQSPKSMAGSFPASSYYIR